MRDGLRPLKTPMLSCDDPTFSVVAVAGQRFALAGEVSGAGSSLSLDTSAERIEVPLLNRSRPRQAVRALKRALPRDVMMTERRRGEEVEVRLLEVLVPAARRPQLRVLSFDPKLRWLQLEENTVEATGMSVRDGFLTVLCDGQRVTVQIFKGLSARAAAARVGASMPHGYRAVVDEATVSVWKDADFLHRVA